MIRAATITDTKGIVDIYNYYVLNSVITFEKEPVTEEEMESRIQKVGSKYPWIVLEENGILGYAYATAWKARAAYRQTVEITVYLHPDHKKRGLGTILYSELIELLRKQNVHAVIGGIAQPNEASIALHEKLGFKKVAHFEEVGYKFDRWVDVAYWELIL